MNELIKSPASAESVSGTPSASLIQGVCVYCGSGKGLKPSYAIAARKLGKSLADNGIRLIYGGGSLGLMGEVARAALGAGGKVSGIIPEFLGAREKMLKDIDELIVVENMHARKQLMFDRSDAFVALPGGVGTLEELVEQLTWSQLGRHTKPIVIANIDGFWDPFLKLLACMKSDTFIREGLDVHYTVVNTAEEILPALIAHAQPQSNASEQKVLAEF
ncbi:TIGR00730 family Rossman fold protein [Hyphomicrobium methylovorum]|uniref:LOG family protein n=1 Tax=Hyphomicrobium methylovorum TaxID=84 RepID=UPI0015E6AED0|nr:TIGR00730 family Rossman fold protein [Hyphomicrobium methylovorum]MBA2127350.1 TIGR00730 family Rossman fold protein [Hyphomicrobium methylovorum]